MLDFLKRPLFGLPTYAWMIGAGVTIAAIIYFTRARSSPATASSGQQMPAQSGFAPVPFPTNSASSGQTVTTPTQSVIGRNNSTIWLHQQADDDSPVGGVVPPGTEMLVIGPPVTGGTFESPLAPGVRSNQWVPVNWLGIKEYAFVPEVQPTNSQAFGSLVQAQ